MTHGFSRITSIGHVPINQLFWIVPFVFLGLMASSVLRSSPIFPEAVSSRNVIDAAGVEVAVPLPFQAIVRFGGGPFLETTHAPEALLKAGSPKDRTFWFAGGIMSRLYPDVLNNDALWDCPSDLESLLAYYDAATYLSPYLDGKAAEGTMRRIGLSALALGQHPKSKDEGIFTATRIEAMALAQPKRGESFIANYKQAYADLNQELKPETLIDLPRVLGMGASKRNWDRLFAFGEKQTQYDGQYQRAGVMNATDGYENTGREQDAERILAMNPDFIFLASESVSDFRHDPRWQGLKAIKDSRVYVDLRELQGSMEPLYGLDFRPLWARWLAAITHPERLQPKLRGLLRDHFMEAYGYRLSEDEIDDLLRIDENKHSVGYARFTKDYLKSDALGLSQ